MFSLPIRISAFSNIRKRTIGPNENLIPLPPEIENFLSDFVEGFIAYGQNELRSGAVINAADSSFSMELGSNHEHRKQALEELIDEGISFRGELFKALQLALRDIRSYEYDLVVNKWRANDRKAKRSNNIVADVSRDAQQR
ncbi:hypothetical protein Y032_0163g3501 [Ancylostoma ceylanicum]|uniref:Uncharacterized protein n=1 Tax=Ancylostoma ceylanicum TaxID=53326 RepID=A0A016SXW0_9BILA|nr:hypothetical protein Y032_0163g3501 [Ancylostoma ceylanicum]